jgi:hypothetical protein
MSAFLSVATFDKTLKVFNCSYNYQVIARYRDGDRVLLGASDSDEAISMRHSWKLRRVPRQLILEDARALHSREMFSLPLSTDGRPLFHPGTEVEIQWRMSRVTAYSWWRGFVRASFLDSSLCFHVASTPSRSNLSSTARSRSRDLPNDPLQAAGGGREEGILVEFPQFPPNSAWRFVIVSLLGLEVENFNGLGFLGGIRPVSCASDSRKWASVFEITMMQIQNDQQVVEQDNDDDENMVDENPTA